MDLDNSQIPYASFPLRAGDRIIFTPGLLHEGLAWTEDYYGRNILLRYNFSKYFNHHASFRLEKHRDIISDDCYELELMTIDYPRYDGHLDKTDLFNRIIKN